MVQIPEFAWVKAPVFNPTICTTCFTHSHKDGFVDLIAEDSAGRRLYMCASCVYTAGQKVGMLSPHQGDELRRQLAHSHEDVLDLQAQLNEEKDNRVISLKDARELFGGNHAPQQPSEVVAVATGSTDKQRSLGRR